ncbi:HEAT repeat domain-containing protein [Singulisphaera rosea]
MFEGLDEIDWEQLTHAYGPAGEVPGWIRGLASDDAKIRKEAFDQLEGNICHQGSRYRASTPAVPFLFELLESPDAVESVRLIQLLVNLAIGYPEWHVPLGFDPAQRFAEIESLGGPEEIERIRASGPEEEDDYEPGRIALWQRDAYEAVIRRVDLFQSLTKASDADVRTAAVKALAWFPEAAPESLKIVRDVPDRESGPTELANALLSVGILAHYQNDESDTPTLLARLSPNQSPSVKLAAAISLAVILGKSAPAQCLDVLLEAVQTPDAPDLVGWHWLGPIAHASAAIMVVKPEPAEAVLVAMYRAAELVENPWSGAEVFKALLNLVFPDPEALGTDPRTGFRRVTPEELTPDQRRAIETIGRAPVWKVEPYQYGMLMDVGLEYGLPWHPDQYETLLEEVRRTHPGG